MSREKIANAINLAFLERLQLFQPLDPSTAYLTCDDEAETMEIPTHRVYYSLLRLHKNKEFAEILSDPVTDILNTSFKEQKVPTGWKLANITPLPKVKHVHYPQKEFRPISLTPALSKIAENFVVTDYIKPAIIKSVDLNQFGTIPGSSTVMALTSMLHKWLGDTDGTGAKIRLCDFGKAFDLIDHSLLITKLKRLDIPSSIINWNILVSLHADHRGLSWARIVSQNRVPYPPGFLKEPNSAPGCFW